MVVHFTISKKCPQIMRPWNRKGFYSKNGLKILWIERDCEPWKPCFDTKLANFSL